MPRMARHLIAGLNCFPAGASYIGLGPESPKTSASTLPRLPSQRTPYAPITPVTAARRARLRTNTFARKRCWLSFCATSTFERENAGCHEDHLEPSDCSPLHAPT